MIGYSPLLAIPTPACAASLVELAIDLGCQTALFLNRGNIALSLPDLVLARADNISILVLHRLHHDEEHLVSNWMRLSESMLIDQESCFVLSCESRWFIFQGCVRVVSLLQCCTRLHSSCRLAGTARLRHDRSREQAVRCIILSRQ
jgi:hypothetical protein